MAVTSLMFATLPVRRASKSQRIFTFTGNYDWQPSNAARQYSTAVGTRVVNMNPITDYTYKEIEDPEEVCRVRHLPKGESHPDLTDGCGDRSDYLELVDMEFQRNHTIHGPLAVGLKQAFETQLNALKQDAKVFSGPGKDHQWLPSWNFGLPVYMDQLAQNNVGHNPGNNARPVSLPIRPAPSPAVPSPAAPAVVPASASAPVIANPVAGRPRGTSDPGPRSPGPRGRTRSMAARVRPVRHLRFYTIGEVGDHLSAESFWVLVNDGNLGYNVFDATGQH